MVIIALFFVIVFQLTIENLFTWNVFFYYTVFVDPDKYLLHENTLF